MKTRIAFIATLLFATVAAFAEDAPKTPAAKALDAWIKSYNADDLAARKEYMKKNTLLTQAQIDEHAPMDIEFRETEGALEIVKVESSTETEIVAQLRHSKSGASPTVRLEVEAAAPHRIKRMSLRM